MQEVIKRTDLCLRGEGLSRASRAWLRVRRRAGRGEVTGEVVGVLSLEDDVCVGRLFLAITDSLGRGIRGRGGESGLLKESSLSYTFFRSDAFGSLVLESVACVLESTSSSGLDSILESCGLLGCGWAS